MAFGAKSPALPTPVEPPKVETKEETDQRAFEEQKKVMIGEQERKAKTLLTSAGGLDDTGLSVKRAGMQGKSVLGGA